MEQQTFIELKTRPVSTNALYRAYSRNGRVRSIKSAAYRDFIEAAGAELIAQKPKKVSGPYALQITIIKGWRGDVDNAAKCLMDLLAQHHVTDNDRNCVDLRIKRGEHPVTSIQIVSTREIGE